jgi:hypothetical protein
MILELDVAAVVPRQASVLAALDVPADAGVPHHIAGLVAAAEEAFLAAAAPVGMAGDLGVQDFGAVYAAAEGNAPESVVSAIAPRAECLALFVVTLGPAVSEAVARGFAERDFARATTLDALASQAADLAAEAVERRVEARWREEERLGPGGAALRYSPGYCGWHVSGQRSLFRRLGPERIGVRLTDGGFMNPTKSVSGVILGGPKSIHRFSPAYPFCSGCATHECRARMRALFGRAGSRTGGAPARRSP